MTKLLIDEPPLQVLPSLAEEIGLNEAIVLQQIHYWLGRSTNVETDQDGTERRWVYKSLSSWQDEMSFWSESTIKRTLQRLKGADLIIAEQKRLDEGDPTVWYSINYDALPPSGQNDQEGEVKVNNSGGQNDHPRARDTTRTRSETTTKSNTESGDAPAREDEAASFSELVATWRDIQATPHLRQRHERTFQQWAKEGAIEDLDTFREVLEEDAKEVRDKDCGLSLSVTRENYEDEVSILTPKQQENPRYTVNEEGEPCLDGVPLSEIGPQNVYEEQKDGSNRAEPEVSAS